MKKINLAITGCMGKMGQKLIRSSKLDKNFKYLEEAYYAHEEKKHQEWFHKVGDTKD